MQRIIQFLTDSRTLAALGLLALAGFLFLGAQFFEIALAWIVAILLLVVFLGIAGWLFRRWQAKKMSGQLGNMLENQADKAASKAQSSRRGEIDIIRKRMIEAIGTIKTSRLGLTSGSSALYELPWYMIIGNPAAGKSSAIANSGLKFPFADKDGSIVQGIGGTRNCDWFFTTDGILLDTAGRYAVHKEDRDEWFGFLDLLKKFRKRAPINGIIIAVSIAELTGNSPEFGINLAKNLRQRVQELTERLEVFAPVYIMFTKVDLIAGFNEFFCNASSEEVARVWGATQAYNPAARNQDILAFFDERFNELYEGLKDMSLANMSIGRDKEMPPGLLTFPLEFAAIRNSLRAFILTLFEDNPYQFRPVFRGFYFTSALQEGMSLGASSQRVADRFDLTLKPQTQVAVHARNGFFLLDLFRKVIFADKSLVAQYASRNKIRLRYLSFFAATLLLGLLLAGWSWSYRNNSQLAENVNADLAHAVRLQVNHDDLQSRMDALQILQDRIEQLQKYRANHPWSLGLGLYQGDLLERKLKEEYFLGVREVMLKPVAANLTAFLGEVNANADKLNGNRAPATTPSVTTANNTQNTNSMYQDASPTQIEDAYNALKTYLMLGDRSHAEPGQLNDQITRFWRGWLESNRGQMPREQMILSAENILGFYLSQIKDPSWPVITTNLALVDQTRETLRKVVHGMPARERIYADIKARASTRYAPMTVASIVGVENKSVIAGSAAIPGVFTREAWEGYVQDAIKDAANKQTQSTDWVLKTSLSDDLTLEGSPEQIQKALTEQYKTEYAQAWQSFLQGVVITDMGNFSRAVAALNKLGDPQNSPVEKIVNTVYQQTSWDNPSLLNAGLQQAQKGIVAWFVTNILRQAPSQLNSAVNTKGTATATGIPVGPVGQRFSGIARLVVVKDKDQSLLSGYLSMLSKVRSRFNQIQNQGDIGPGARQFMQQTLDAKGSELGDALKYVDEQMLLGMTDEQKQVIRPLLVRPLMQAFNAIIKPTETDLNKTWLAQVYNPFQMTLAGKYPFAPDSHMEASSQEIAQVFGPDGSIAKFFGTEMASLIVRRGDTVAARTWADLGIHLAPRVSSDFANWIAPVTAGGTANSAATAQTLFQIQPLPAAGVLEYTIDIDGQVLRYRNTAAGWTNFVWPNAQGTPGARIVAVTYDGRSVEIVNEPGRFGLERLLSTATRKRKDDGGFELSWANGATSVAVNLKLISSPQASSSSTSTLSHGFKGMRLPMNITETPPVAAAPSVVTPPAQPVVGATQ